MRPGARETGPVSKQQSYIQGREAMRTLREVRLKSDHSI
jgi:hypothetical protein